MPKESFIIYNEWNTLIEGLTDAQVGQIFKGILAIQNGNGYEFTSDVAGIANFFITQINKNNKKYEETCKRKSESAKKRFERTKQHSNTFENSSIHSNTLSDNDNDNEHDNENDNENDNERVINNSHNRKEKKSVLPREENFSIPTLDEVKDYFFYHMDYEVNSNEPINFYSYNQARQWQGVKDWHPLADMWHRKFKESQKTDEDVINDVYSQFKAMYKGGDSDE